MLNGRFRFVAILAVLLISGFVVTSFISYFVARSSLSTQILEDTLPLTSDNIYSEIQQDLLRPIFVSSLMANDTFLTDWVKDGEKDVTQITRYLAAIQKRYKALTTFYVSEKSRNYYHASGLLKQINEKDFQDIWYFKSRANQELYEINLDSDTADRSTLTIFINHKVYDEKGDFLGITGIGLAVEAVKDLIDTYQKRYGRQIFFVDRVGNVTLKSRELHLASNIHDSEGVARVATQILANPAGTFSYEGASETIYLNSRLVPEFNWYLIVMEENAVGEVRIERTFFVNLAVSLCVTVVVLLLCYLTLGGYQRRLEKMATTDKLTGLVNRQALDFLFDNHLKRSIRDESNLSVILLDIDHFKTVNDTYGHLVGDEVIQRLAKVIKKNTRDSDIISRWGGEEFLILLPECNLQFAKDLAEKIRQAVEDEDMFISGNAISVSASFGVSTYEAGDDENAILNRSDSALYTAKENGRNRVESKT